jgi:SlyX protein
MTTVYIGKTLDKQNLRPKISSNSSMEPIHNTQQTVDARITELEIKASYTEDLLDQLDKVIVRQQEQIDLLIKEITDLRQSSTDGGLGVARNLRDDLPPHF